MNKPDFSDTNSPNRAMNTLDRMEKNSEAITRMFNDQNIEVDEALSTILIAAVGVSVNGGGSKKKLVLATKVTWDNVCERVKASPN